MKHDPELVEKINELLEHHTVREILQELAEACFVTSDAWEFDESNKEMADYWSACGGAVMEAEMLLPITKGD